MENKKLGFVILSIRAVAAVHNFVAVVAAIALVRKLGLVGKRNIHIVFAHLDPVAVDAVFVVRRLDDHIAVFVVRGKVGIFGSQ